LRKISRKHAPLPRVEISTNRNRQPKEERQTKTKVLGKRGEAGSEVGGIKTVTLGGSESYKKIVITNGQSRY